MMLAFKEKQTSIIAVEKIHASQTTRYGIVDVASQNETVMAMRGIVEKPKPEEAPSDLGVVGRYILTPQIFDLLQTTHHGSGGEIQLTDAIASLLSKESVYAYQFQGKRYDCGSKLGYLEATVAYALKHPELAMDFKRVLETIVA